MKAKLSYVVRHNLFLNLDYGQAVNQFEYFRIAVATFSLLGFGAFLIDCNIFLDPNGIINWEVTNAGSFWFEPHLLKFSHFLHLSPMQTLYFAIFCYVSSLVCLILGISTRVASIVSFACFFIFSIVLNPFLYGVELYQSVFLLMLCVFPSGYRFSLMPKNPVERIINQQQIGIRGIQAYLALTYFAAGFGKVKMESWLNGKFIFLSLSDPSYKLLDFPLDLHHNFYALLGFVVVVSELFYCAFIFIPYLRSILLLSIVSMHFFISLFMGLVPFGVLLIIANLVAWYPLLIQDIKTLRK